MVEHCKALVVGSGPAGLMAANALLNAGIPVVMAEAMPSPARKFLMAGKSGLNLTKAEPRETFLSHYREAYDWLQPMIAAFGPPEVEQWAQSLGQALFTGSSGRIFPVSMKASPLLRGWLNALVERGLDLRRSWRLVGRSAAGWSFETANGPAMIQADRTVLALGGASWSRLGSDGSWTALLGSMGVELAPFAPANMGFRVDWSSHMERHFGQPLKAVALYAGDEQSRGESVVTRAGIEGGGIYSLSRALRLGAPLVLDLFPDLSAEEIKHRWLRRSPSESFSNKARKALNLTGLRLAMVQELVKPLPSDTAHFARLLKALPVPLLGPAPMDQAISVAGGVTRGAVDAGLMLKAAPGVFVCGEMLDWEAPTGGYLLTACLSTGRWAGRSAAQWSADRQPRGDHSL